MIESKVNKLTFFIFAYWHDPQWKKFVGATIKIWDLSNNLSQLGHQVTLFLPKYNFNKKNIPFKVIEVPLINFPFLRSLSFSISLAFISLFFLKHSLDVVYVRRGISLIPFLFSKLKNTLLFYEVNDDPYYNNSKTRGIFNPVFKHTISILTDQIYLKTCHIGSVITEGLKNKICQNLSDFSKRKLMVIPSGANLSLFKPLDKNECRNVLKYYKSKKYIGFIGSLLAHQGIDILIDATPYVIEKIPQTVFLVFGEGPMKKKWIEEVNKKDLQSWFYFIGQIDYENLTTYIGALDICVAPFLRSAGLRSPVKIFDYLACGKPVVASYIDGTTDIFVESGAVILVPPENAKVLGETIVELLNDEEKIKNLGEKGRSFVEANYDRSAMAKKISDEIISFLKGA